MASPDEKMRFALIGLGMVGPAHARALNELDTAEIAVVCDVNRERAEEFARKYQCDCCTDYRDVVARDDVEVMDVTVPQFAHVDIAVAAAEAGKHVIVEKPIAVTSEEGQRIIDVCEANDVKLAVVFQSRWKKSFLALKQALQEGRLGDLLLGDVYVKWFRPQEYYDSGQWRGTWKGEGGGALINQSIHSIDILQWLMGPVESLSAQIETTCLHDIEVEDLAVAVMKFESGALGVIEGATALKPGLPERIEIHGTAGTVIIEGGVIKLWNVDEMDEEEVKALAEEPSGTGASDPMDFPIAWHKAQIKDMIDAIRNDRSPAVDGGEGIKALRIIEAIYESARNAERVTLQTQIKR